MAKTKATKSKSSPAKAKKTEAKGAAGGDTANKILSFLFEMHEMGMEDVKVESILKESGYARTDSTGYRKAMKQVIKEQEFVEKNGQTMRLTEKGMSHMSSKAGPIANPTTNKDVEEQFKKRIMKFSKNKAPEEKLNAIWLCLSDGKPHERDELLLVAGYKRPDSTGYREIMKWMGKLELVEKPSKTTFKFVAKNVLPFAN